MPTSILKDVTDLITTDPHSGTALNLYALISTLRMEKTGYMYMLRKLRDLSPEGRQLAYRLMEFMAQGGNEGEIWERALEQMDRAIREG